MVDFNYFLARKYALLQQQADAGTTNAASGAITANAQAGALGAAANVDNTRARLMPAESAAAIALQGAQTRLTGNQADVVIPMAQANIGNINANTALTGTQNKVLVRNELTPRSELFGGGGIGALPTLGGGGFRFSEEPLSITRPARRGNESSVRYMDRTGWGAGYGAERTPW